MGDKVHKTKGIVLRRVKYGETSLIVSIYTELFGLQSYLINGVRTSSAKGSGKANLFQPTAILEMVVMNHNSKPISYYPRQKLNLIHDSLLDLQLLDPKHSV